MDTLISVSKDHAGKQSLFHLCDRCAVQAVSALGLQGRRAFDQRLQMAGVTNAGPDCQAGLGHAERAGVGFSRDGDGFEPFLKLPFFSFQKDSFSNFCFSGCFV